MLLHDTDWLVQCSNICPAKDALFPNHNQLIPKANGDTSKITPKPIIHSITDRFEEPIKLPQFSPEELLGMKFISDDGTEFHAKVIRKVLVCDAQDHQMIKFLLALG